MNGHLRLSIHHPIDKTLAALKISKSTLYKYYTDGQIETAIVKKKQVKYDDFDMGVIRRKVLSFFARGVIATLTKVYNQLLSDNPAYHLSRSTIYKLLKKDGFSYKKRLIIANLC